MPSSFDPDTAYATNFEAGSRVPRERKVPSTPLGRVVGFAGLAINIALGTLADVSKRKLRRKPAAGTPGDGAGGDAAAGVAGAGADGGSAIISEANAERLASGLCRMRGAALKIGQMLSIQDESSLPPQFQAILERVRQEADVMPQSQLNSVTQKKTLSRHPPQTHRHTHNHTDPPFPPSPLQVMTEELGPEWRGRFDRFEPLPMAAASIGQVP